ncbi:SLC2A4 regulator [Manis javanica]|nr:SLC2A4 regulator [Manis javanica]
MGARWGGPRAPSECGYASAPGWPAMEAPRPPAPGLGCGRLPLRAAGRDPAAAPVSVPGPLQGPAGGGGGGFAGSEFARPQEPEPRAADLGAPGLWAGPPTRSVHIPVPAQRAPPGKSRLDEVMAAVALTSLSNSRLLLGAPTAACSPEPGLEPWKEGFVRPPGSWGWDLAAEQSSPSAPSPPLPPEAAHFLLGEPARRKRKSSVQALFQCLWKQCGKVLSTASGMQRHVRLVHLGRQAEPEQSDGEEDFYYTELDAGVETLTEGLSSLTPVSPVACGPPAFPHLGLPEAPALPPTPVVGSAVPTKVCHSDHAYQAGEVTGRTWEPVSGRSRGEQGHSCASPQDCLGPAHPEPQLSTFRACSPALPSKLGASPRKPQGDARKCRKVYGTDRRDLWCTACRWKKACRRLPD